MVDFREVIDTLIEVGFYEVFLPFILVYAVVFAILQKSKIFEGGSSDQKQAKNINAVVALVFGLFVVTSIQVVQFFQDLIVNISVIIVFILCVLIVLGFIFGDSYQDLFKDNKIRYSLASLIFLISIIILFNVLGWIEIIQNWWDSNSGSDWLVGILVIAGIIGVLYVITKGDSEENSKNE